jgi:hypothetical protein
MEVRMECGLERKILLCASFGVLRCSFDLSDLLLTI